MNTHTHTHTHTPPPSTNAEYGFFANVNPAYRHPRRSLQATERRLVDSPSGTTLPTEIYNGYGPEVAHMYANLLTGDATTDRKYFF
jgi:hypothetical protein